MRVCQSCETYIAHTHEGAFCPHCDDLLIDRGFLDDQFYECPVCGMELQEFDQSWCQECGLTLGISFWRGAIEDLNFSAKLSSSGPLSLCCNQPESACTCDIPLQWNDVHSVPKDIDEDAYEMTAECSACVKWYSEDCMPYRSWCKDFLLTGVIPYPIDGCTEFQGHKFI